MGRNSRLTAALRRIEAKSRIIDGGEVHYADVTPVGTVIDNTRDDREVAPLVLERYLPRLNAWQVVESFPDWDKALPRAKKAKLDLLH
jgi:hypothetical protein